MKLLIKSNAVSYGIEPSSVEYGKAVEDAQKYYLKMLEENGFKVIFKESISPFVSEVEYYCKSWGPDKISVDVTVRENSIGPDRITQLCVGSVNVSVYSRDPVVPYRTIRECNMYDLVQDILPNIYSSDEIIWK